MQVWQAVGESKSSNSSRGSHDGEGKKELGIEKERNEREGMRRKNGCRMTQSWCSKRMWRSMGLLVSNYDISRS